MSDMNNNDWVCPKCGTLNNSGNFCVECGEPKPAVPVTPAPQVAPETSAAPAPAPVPSYSQKPKEKPEDEKAATMMCLISVLCMYATPVVTGIVGRLCEALPSQEAAGIVSMVMVSVAGLSWIASIVLMIIVRVKYRQNLFGKILMWVYIGQLILAIIGCIILFVACAAFVDGCNQGSW